MRMIVISIDSLNEVHSEELGAASICASIEDTEEVRGTWIGLPGNIVDESQLIIPTLGPDTMLSNMVPLESVEYHDEHKH